MFDKFIKFAMFLIDICVFGLDYIRVNIGRI